MTDGPQDRDPFGRFKVEIDPDKVEEAVKRLRERLAETRDRVEQGFSQVQYTRVRLSYRGRRVGPDIPLSLFLAGEVAFVALAPLYALLGNLAGKAVLEVELIHEADELVTQGREAFGHGEVEEAERRYREALERRQDDPAALYHLGVLLRVTGRADEALRCFRKAAMGPPAHPDVVRAAETLDRLSGKRNL